MPKYCWVKVGKTKRLLLARITMEALIWPGIESQKVNDLLKEKLNQNGFKIEKEGIRNYFRVVPIELKKVQVTLPMFYWDGKKYVFSGENYTEEAYEPEKYDLAKDVLDKCLEACEFTFS